MLKKTLESSLDCKEIDQSILKKIHPEFSLGGLMLKLKIQYFDHLMRRAGSFENISEKEHHWGNRNNFTGLYFIYIEILNHVIVLLIKKVKL